MAYTLGALTLDYPLIWVNKGANVVAGTDFRGVDGALITFFPTTTNQDAIPATFTFQWVSWSQVETIYDQWQAGDDISINPENSGSMNFRYSRQGGVSGVIHASGDRSVVPADVAGTDLDLWNGTIRGYIIS